MKVCLAQINTTPGDFEGNLDRMRAGLSAAVDAAADLLIFPELTIPGYLSQDLLYNPEFIDRNLQVLETFVEETNQAGPDLYSVVGYIGRNNGIGKPFTNMAAVISDGAIIRRYQKQLLPFYDVFDELRYFEPGNETCVFEVRGHTVGVAICEDLWNDKGADDYNYHDNPMEQYRRQGVDVVCSLNSSPFVQGKTRQRLSHIAPATIDGPTVLYVNQVGGQDELVFDGQSFIVRDGQLLHLENRLFEDSFEVLDLDDLKEDMPELETEKAVSLKDLLVLGLRDYARKSGFEQLVLASSGGVDSAVVCMLACDALGPANVHAVRMPSVFSSEHSRDDAKALHKNLGCWDYEVPVDHDPVVKDLNSAYEKYNREGNLVHDRLNSGSYSKVADENIQARLRDVYLMHFSNAYGAMPLSTGNKTESGCGYYTHFDMNFSYAPIKDLYKFQVMDIAKSDERIPANIWQKPPSAELAEDQTDEANLMPYPILDPIVMAYVEDYVTSFDRFRAWIDDSEGSKISADETLLRAWLQQNDAPDDYLRIVSLIGRMEYKRRQTCPGTKVSKVAFGIGRRIPIVEKWN